MLNFEEFAMEVKENLKEYLPEKYENSKIVVKDVEKCNGTRKGIVIMPEEVTGTNIAPNLYLEKYYDDYLGGEELANVMEAIASDYARADKDIDVSMLYEVMDIPLVDHIIVGRNTTHFFSFKENSIMPKPTNIYPENPGQIAFGSVAEGRVR